MKTMTDKQFKKALEKLNEFKLPTKRGGRSSIVIPDKKKTQNKKACRNNK